MPHTKPKKDIVVENMAASAEQIQKKYGKPLPAWWPFHSDGMAALHLYRLIDEEKGKDLEFPGFEGAMSHKLRANEVVDFTDQTVQLAALLHVSRFSEGNYKKRPFISASWDFEALISFGSRKLHEAEKTNKSVVEVWVRIDLVALWLDGLFTEKSFADISSIDKFTMYFTKIRNDYEYEDYCNCLQASVKLKEVLIGTRGNWWVPYSLLISMADAVESCQIGGYENTVFGERLMEMYSSQGEQPSTMPHVPRPIRPCPNPPSSSDMNHTQPSPEPNRSCVVEDSSNNVQGSALVDLS